MPNHRLKRFGVGRYVRRVDYWNEYTSVCDLCSVAPITADHATNGGPHFLGVFEGPHQVGADVLRCVASADGKNEYHVLFIQPRSVKPVGVARFPAVIVHPRCEFGNIVRWRVCFDLSNLAEVAGSVGGVTRPAADTKEKESAGPLAQFKEQIGSTFNG